jgi:hypothetical protein
MMEKIKTISVIFMDLLGRRGSRAGAESNTPHVLT